MLLSRLRLWFQKRLRSKIAIISLFSMNKLKFKAPDLSGAYFLFNMTKFYL